MAVKLTNEQRKPVVICNGPMQVRLAPGESRIVNGSIRDWSPPYGVLATETTESVAAAPSIGVDEGPWIVTNKQTKPLVLIYNNQHTRLAPGERVQVRGNYDELVRQYGLLVEPVTSETKESVPSAVSFSALAVEEKFTDVSQALDVDKVLKSMQTAIAEATESIKMLTERLNDVDQLLAIHDKLLFGDKKQGEKEGSSPTRHRINDSSIDQIGEKEQ